MVVLCFIAAHFCSCSKFLDDVDYGMTVIYIMYLFWLSFVKICVIGALLIDILIIYC